MILTMARRVSLGYILFCLISFCSLAIYLQSASINWYENAQVVEEKAVPQSQVQIASKQNLPVCTTTSINLIENGDFSNGIKRNLSGFSYHDWWADGEKAFNVVDTTLQVSCVPQALGLYQYIQVSKPESLIGLRLKYKLNLSENFQNRTGTSTHHFRGVAVRLQGQTLKESRLLFFEGEGSVTHTIKVNFIVESIIVVVSCVGYSGTMSLEYVNLSPVLEKRKQINFMKNSEINNLHVCEQKNRMLVDPSFSYTETKLHFGEKSTELVSLVTHTTVDRLNTVAFALSQWGVQDGAAATVVIYDKEFQGSQQVLAALEKGLKTASLVLRSLEFTYFVVIEPLVEVPYPINSLRNIALKRTHTPYALIVDADLIPSKNCRTEIDSALKSKSFRKVTAALVIPAFEDNLKVSQTSRFHGYVTRSDSKSKFKRLVDRGIFSPYKAQFQPRAHEPTNYTKWWAATLPYEVQYKNQYEPYVVVKVENNPTLPIFDSRFVGYGWNKVSFIYELNLSNYSFFVMPSCWLVHRSHPKTVDSLSFASSLRTRIENRAIRYMWLFDMMPSE